MTTETATAAVHIPAWRRLGLKLTYAKDEASPQVQPSSLSHGIGSSGGKKRKVTEGAHDVSEDSVVNKKRKLPSATSDQQEKEKHIENDKQEERTPKGKSVSFTPETKKEDGDGTRNIYQDWFDSKKAKEKRLDSLDVIANSSNTEKASEDPDSKVPLAVSSEAEPATVPAKKVKAKVKKAQAQTNTKQQSSIIDGGAAAAAVRSYLDDYAKGPPVWKFSKISQKHLLKDILSTTLIPSSYDSSILLYLRGLASPALRTRIRDEVLQATKADDQVLRQQAATTVTSIVEEGGMGVENETAEQVLRRKVTEYEAAVARIKEALHRRDEVREEWDGLEEWGERMAKRRRAEVVLRATIPTDTNGEHTSSPLPSVTSTPPNATSTTTAGHASPLQPQQSPVNPSNPAKTLDSKNKRKRRRTAKERALYASSAIPDDYSSSSSDSDSEARREKSKREAEERERQREKLAARRRELEALKRELEDAESGSESGSEIDDA